MQKVVYLWVAPIAVVLKVIDFIYWLHCVACGILVPQQRTEPVSPAPEVQRPNHWTTRDVAYSVESEQILGDAVEWFKNKQTNQKKKKKLLTNPLFGWLWLSLKLEQQNTGFCYLTKLLSECSIHLSLLQPRPKKIRFLQTIGAPLPSCGRCHLSVNWNVCWCWSPSVTSWPPVPYFSSA